MSGASTRLPLGLGLPPAPAGYAAPTSESLLGIFGRIVGTGLELVAKAFATLQEENGRLRGERDRAREEARLLAHAARAGMRPPEELLERVLAYPVLPPLRGQEPKA